MDDSLQRLLAAFDEEGLLDGLRAEIEADAKPEPESKDEPEP